MTPLWSSPTVLALGLRGLRDRMDSHDGDVVLVVDTAVADQLPARQVADWAGRKGAFVRRVLVDGAARLEDLTALSHDIASDPAVCSPLVVAVGGGAAMDLATLLALVHEQPRALSLVSSPQRSGLVLLPQDLRRTLPLAVVPTTVGTGAEMSSSACVDLHDARRLVVGEAMRPDLAALDPEATRTLPPLLFREGVLEALFRLTSMMIGDTQDRPVEDALALTLVEQLVAAGDALRRHGDDVPDDLRLDIAKLSGLTQGGWLTLGRNRYSAKGWYVATELSLACSSRKVTAVARLLPALWDTIAAGSSPWGDPGRLEQVWQRIRRTTAATVPSSAGRGICALIEWWDIPVGPPLPPEDRDRVARRAVRAWGSGLPMLLGLRSTDVRRLLDAAHDPPHVVAQAPSGAGATTTTDALATVGPPGSMIPSG